MPSLKQFKSKEEYNNWFKDYRKRFPEKWREYRKKWRKKNGHDYLRYKIDYPEKYRAHKIVAHAIKIGFLKRQSCETCGKPNAHGHHDDYSKPLKVKWLCPVHHAKLHVLKIKR